MNSSRIVIHAVLASLIIGEGIYAWRLSREIASLKVSRAELDAAGSAQRLAAAEASLKAARSLTVAQLPQVKSADKPEAVEKPAAAAVPMRKLFVGAINHKDFRSLALTRARFKTRVEYGPLFDKLRLDPEQQKKLGELIMEKQEVKSVATEHGLDSHLKGADLKKAIEQAQSDVNGRIEAFLGKPAYSEYQQYERSRGMRSVVDSLKESLSYSATPLNDEAAARLVKLWYDRIPVEQRPDASGLTLQQSSGLSIPPPFAVVTDDVVTMAREVLSVEQLRALEVYRIATKPPGGS